MILEQIQKNGYFQSEEIISLKDLSDLRIFVNSKLNDHPKTNFRLYEENFKNSILTNIDFKKKIQDLIDKIVLECFKDFKSKKSNIYRVLRIVSGKKQKKQAHLYHFDAHLITLLIPIFVPNNENKKNGDLVIFPNIRKVHKNLLINIVQKFFFQNLIIRNFLKINIIKKFLNHKIVKIKPGSVYAFIGFATLHGNLEIDTKSTRATLLVHAYDIFDESRLVNINRERAIKKENKIIS